MNSLRVAIDRYFKIVFINNLLPSDSQISNVPSYLSGKNNLKHKQTQMPYYFSGFPSLT
jgi:hypothetical protein